MKNSMVAVLVLTLLVVSTGALIFESNDSSAATTYTVNVITPDGVKHTGTGSNLESVILSVTGSDLVINAAGRIDSYKGQSAPDGKAWMLFNWKPAGGSSSNWAPITFNNIGNSTLVNGTTYVINLSDATKVGTTTTYSEPSSNLKPISTAYFFIKFAEEYNISYVLNLLTEQQRKDGFWISGTGSTVAEAFANACAAYKFEIIMDMGDGTASDGSTGWPVGDGGWIGSFMTLTDDDLLSDGTSWLYWAQFQWTGSEWHYDDATLGYYDPGVYHYFTILRHTGYMGDSYSGPSPTASAINVLSTDSVWNGIHVDKTSMSLSAGKTGQITATVNPSDDVDKSVKWVSSNTNVATVDANGTVVGVSAGNATITASTNGGAYKATTTVTVTAPTKVTSVTVDKTSMSLTSGNTGQLTATVSPSNATDKSVTWSSSSTSVATVSNSGLVTAVGAGTATITATTIDGGYTAICAVTVSGGDSPTTHVTGVSLNKTSMSLTSGNTGQLTATVSPSNATDKSVTWSSSSTSVATVSNSGLVTAVGAGTATITATTTDGGYTAECTVDVTTSDNGTGSNTMLYVGIVVVVLILIVIVGAIFYVVSKKPGM